MIRIKGEMGPESHSLTVYTEWLDDHPRLIEEKKKALRLQGWRDLEVEEK